MQMVLGLSILKAPQHRAGAAWLTAGMPPQPLMAQAVKDSGKGWQGLLATAEAFNNGDLATGHSSGCCSLCLVPRDVIGIGIGIPVAGVH